ncbi:MAG: hypothetical protein ACREIR_15315 [Geminicoccaceae bacterium]
MSTTGAAPRAAVPASNARAEASRKNGAKSRGPKTPEGKARAAQNALKHGLRAGKHVLLPDEDSDEFEALETALFEELAPEGALQGLLAGRIARAAWRLARAERIEVEMFAARHYPGGGPGLAIIRDGNSTRSFETLLRYRGAALAEFTRCLRTLQALQAKPVTEPGKRAAIARSAAPRMLRPRRARSGERALDRAAGKVQPQANPIEPETRGDRGNKSCQDAFTRVEAPVQLARRTGHAGSAGKRRKPETNADRRERGDEPRLLVPVACGRYCQRT